MKGQDKKPQHPEEGIELKSPAVQELRRRLAEPGPWAQRFQRLAEAIAQVEDLPCEICEDLLDVYVAARLASLPPEGGTEGRPKGVMAQHFPALWRHLQRCDECRAAYEALLESLAEENQGESRPVSPALPRLSFLEPPAPNALWIKRLRSRLAGASFSLTFTLMPRLLERLVSPTQAQPIPTRAAGTSSQPRVLVLDTVALEEGLVGVEVIAIPSEQHPDRLRLQATIAGPIPPEGGTEGGLISPLQGGPRGGLWAVLTWGDETRTGVVDEQGQVDLGEISLAILKEALETGEGTFEITFESRDTST